MRTLRLSLFTSIIALCITSCVSLYDHYTYTETIETKLEALSLVDKSDEEFASHEAAVVALKNQIEKMLIYERGKNKNIITIKMWEVLHNDKNLIGSYLKLWEEKGRLNPVFIDEAKPQIEQAFDILIQFEEKKDKKSETILSNFINNL
jgi:hypothetical protein